jgi:hypothetical protein
MSRVTNGVFACLLLASGCKTDNPASGIDPRALLDLKKNCVEAGERARTSLFEMHRGCAKESGAPRFAYNGELKTCLYADRCIVSGPPPVDFFIVDAFSNSILVEYDVLRRKYSGSLPNLPSQPSGEEVFQAKFRELFGPNAQPPRCLGEP